ncbi:MAG TPA: PD-(D/E)XK nuclease family protein, partial [Solirubrobacterales bacterium]
AAEREAEEELRLFHVAATRARERLIVSGVVNPKEGKESKGKPVIERLVETLGVPRDEDSIVPVAAPSPRPGLEAELGPSEIAVKVNLPSPERATELRTLRREGAAARDLGEGPPPLVERKPPTVPSRPLSYTAISAYKECPYRFYMERVLGMARIDEGAPSDELARSRPEERTARGAAVHALLEWSQAHGWALPSEELVVRHAVAAGLGTGSPSPDTARQWLAVECPERETPSPLDSLLEPVRAWISSPLRERIAAEAANVRAEVPLLLGVGGTVLRGSIDLLVEREEEPPLVVDYKTDRLDGADPAERAAHYEVQRSIYALAVAEALGAEEVEVAYVFLERPDEPVVSCLGSEEMAAARASLEETIGRINRGEFPVAPPEERDWSLCRGCPALRGLCSGPRSVEAGGEVV